MKCYDRRPHFVFVHEHDIMSSLAAPALLPPRPASRPPPALLRHAHRETHPSHATRGLGDHLPLQLQLRWGVERLDLHGQEGLAEPGRLPQVIRVLFEVTSRRWMALGFGLRE